MRNQILPTYIFFAAFHLFFTKKQGNILYKKAKKGTFASCKYIVQQHITHISNDKLKGKQLVRIALRH